MIAIAGLSGTMTLQYVAYSTAPIVAANALTYVWPLAAAAWFALRVRDRRSATLGLLAGVGFLGVLLTIAGTAEGGGGSRPITGLLCALASAACMALFTVSSDESASPHALLPATASAAMVGATWVLAARLPAPSAIVWPIAVAMGVGQMAAGYWLWGYAMSAGRSQSLAGLGYLTPLLSTLLLLLVGASATVPAIAGVAVIFLSSLGVLAENIIARRRGASDARPGHGSSQV